MRRLAAADPLLQGHLRPNAVPRHRTGAGLRRLHELPAALLAPTDSLFRQYPACTVPSPEAERRCRCGNPLTMDVPDGLYRVYGADGAFLCLSRAEGGTLTSLKNFFGA